MPTETTRRRFAAWVVESEFPLAELPPAAGPPDWRIVGDATALRRDGVRWYMRTRAADGLPWLWLGRCGDEDVLRFYGLAWCRIRHVTREIAVVWERRLGPPEYEHLLVNHILPLVASAAGFLVLHASVVVRPSGGAVAIVGPVGAGKSTLAGFLASRGWPILSDDRLIVSADHVAQPVAPDIRVSPDAASQFGFAFTLPPGHRKVRVRPGTHRDGAPLERIVMLDRRDGPARLQPLSGSESVLDVLAALLQLGLDAPAVRGRVFAAVTDLVEAVPCARLQSPRDWPSLDIAEALLQPVSLTRDR
jgi:hypothetical protein